MNTKTKQPQRTQRRRKVEPKKARQHSNTLHDDRKYHEQERPETRMFR